jgi:hypothetical protein
MNVATGIDSILIYLRNLDRPVQVLAVCLIAQFSLGIAYLIVRRRSLSQLRHEVERLRHELDLLRVNMRISQIKPPGTAPQTAARETPAPDASSAPPDAPTRNAPPDTSHVRPIQWLSLD